MRSSRNEETRIGLRTQVQLSEMAQLLPNRTCPDGCSSSHHPFSSSALRRAERPARVEQKQGQIRVKPCSQELARSGLAQEYEEEQRQRTSRALSHRGVMSERISRHRFIFAQLDANPTADCSDHSPLCLHHSGRGERQCAVRCHCSLERAYPCQQLPLLLQVHPAIRGPQGIPRPLCGLTVSQVRRVSLGARPPTGLCELQRT